VLAKFLGNSSSGERGKMTVSTPAGEAGIKSQKIHALTSLRFFAAFWVVLFHTLRYVVPYSTLPSDSFIGRALSFGNVSVSFFFFLSGYILSVVYLRPGKPIQKRGFYIARFARVYPLYFVTLLADLPILLLTRSVIYGWKITCLLTSVTLLGDVVMLQAWITRLRGLNGPSWSLSVEAVFYLIFPFIGVWLWRMKGKLLWLTAAGLWVGGQLLVFLATPHMPTDVVLFNPLAHIPTFLLGILFAKWQLLQRERYVNAPPRFGLVIASLIAIAGLGIAINWLPVLNQTNICDGLMVPCFAGLIWVFSASESLPARILSPRWLVVLGEASYGLYLIHYPVKNLWNRLHWMSIPALYPLYLATCIGISVLSFYFFETPTRKWILKKFHSRTKETMEAASDAQ
jgi:peptidoglycan/LPS O-acetylase OafA/YrhL